MNLADGTTLTPESLAAKIAERANLAGANLAGANLEGAYLARANLAGANLERAKIADNVILPEGVTFGEFLDVVLPELFKAGGKAVLPAAWDCHSWDNCPMAEAFGVHGLNEVPIVWRPWTNRFVQLFDGKALEDEVKARIFAKCGIGCALPPRAAEPPCPCPAGEHVVDGKPVAKPKRKPKKRGRK